METNLASNSKLLKDEPLKEISGYNENISAGHLDTISNDIKLKDESFKAKGSNKKRPRVTEEERERKRIEEMERKQKAQELYNQEMEEQRYKLLMHLLNKSKFYSNFIINKINKPQDKAHKQKYKGDAPFKDENSPPTVDRQKPDNYKSKHKKLAKNYDIREYIAPELHQKVQQKNLSLSEDEIENALAIGSDDETNTNTTNVVETLKYFDGDLYPYQKEGLHWMIVLYENGLNGILADEMGLGKTVQVIALLCHLIEKQQDGPYLIVVPLSTLPNWISEFERFAPKLPVVTYYGGIVERMKLRRTINRKYPITDTYSTQPIVLTTFEVPIADASFLRLKNWRYIVVDEGHRIKNHETQLATVLRSFTSMNRLLLTGTPLQNSLAELWSLLNFLLPEIFDDLKVFESWFDVNEMQDARGAQKLLKQEEEKRVIAALREILKPFMLRREKADLNLKIPPRKEIAVYAPLTELQHDLYQAILNRDLDKLSKIETPNVIIETENGKRPRRTCTFKKTYASNNRTKNETEAIPFNKEMSPYDLGRDSEDNSVLKQTKSTGNEEEMWKKYSDKWQRNLDFFVRLKFSNTMILYKKVVNHPYLIHCPLDSTGLPLIDERLVKASGKLLVLDAMLPRFKRQGHKVLLFSTMTMILDIIEDYLLLRDYQYVRLDGSIKVKDREEAIKRFNQDSDVLLFLISTRAGGVGLNLASADTVIIYDSDWNPQADLQAMARCHRIGQKRPVVVYRFCTKGTVDEAIIRRANAKRTLEKMVISKDLGIKLNFELLTELKKLLDETDCHIVKPENQVFTEEELDKLLDRSDLFEEEINENQIT